MWSRCVRLLRHRWREPDVRQLLPPAAVARLAERVAAGERTHTGQVRLFIEAGLPWRYVWRGASARERAVAQFGKLRVWDTERNNGVLVYLLLAEHAIEIVADRGLSARVPQSTWDALVARLSQDLREGSVEAGLGRALDEVAALMATHFPAGAGDAPRTNELPDEPAFG